MAAVTIPQHGRGRWSSGYQMPAGWVTGLGDTRPVTNAIGSGLLSAGGVIAAIPGGQLPGAIVAAVGAFTGLIGGLFKPDLTKIEATHIVDAIQVQLEQLLHGWYALPPEQKTAQNQAAFLELIDAALNKVQQGCSNPQLGTAGEHCISERLVKGGSAPWCPTVTGCDWITTYRDPITNDPTVSQNIAAAQQNTNPPTSSNQPGVTPGSGAAASTGAAASLFDMQSLMLWGGIALLVIGIGVVAFGGDD